MNKHVLRPDRLRRVPPQFSWLDQRLFRNGRTAPCDADALALYLFLVVVADAQGLSFYSDASIARLLRWEGLRLAVARRQLVAADLLAFEAPLYQVLSLDPLDAPAARLGTALSVGDILRRALRQGGPA
jgi:hypothetical protein